MTEAEWLACGDLQMMLRYLRGKASERKLRLFACACVRSIEHLLKHPRSLPALAVAEQFADGLISAYHLQNVEKSAKAISQALRKERGQGWQSLWAASAAVRHALQGLDCAREAASKASEAVIFTTSEPGEATRADWRLLEAVQCDLLRHIVGDPFGSISTDSSWFTTNVRILGQSIYDERTYHHMPILADALQEAGCDNADILDHCRTPGEHVRGCWVLDLILGRT